jgi:hypothetical protein
MRLRDRTSVEPLQKMIPEFAGELPGPIARALDLSHHFSASLTMR